MEIRAFKALRFNDQITGDTGSCISPPYDVIDGDMQQKLYDSNEYNIVRVIKGKTTKGDTAENNQYTRAADFLNSSCQAGALKQDQQEAIYAYVQDFEANSKPCCRSGFVALGKIEEFGEGVKAHEKTLDGPKADRLNLMRATGAQFGQIFMLFDDPAKIADAIIAKAAQGTALIDFTDDSVRHRLFAIDDAAEISAIAEMMSDKAAVIADGHHRYETALNYYRESGNPGAQFRMMTFVNMHNEGLVILPTHRLVGNLDNFDINALTEQLKDKFEVTAYDFAGDDEKAT